MKRTEHQGILGHDFREAEGHAWSKSKKLFHISIIFHLE